MAPAHAPSAPSPHDVRGRAAELAHAAARAAQARGLVAGDQARHSGIHSLQSDSLADCSPDVWILGEATPGLPELSARDDEPTYPVDLCGHRTSLRSWRPPGSRFRPSAMGSSLVHSPRGRSWWTRPRLTPSADDYCGGETLA
jgi:hypothetical protein